MGQDITSEFAALREATYKAHATMVGISQILESIAIGKMVMSEYIAETLSQSLLSSAENISTGMDSFEKLTRSNRINSA